MEQLPRVLLLLSGPAASGKTTSANELVSRGWAAGSTGSVVRSHQREAESVAEAGERINQTHGQTWLCEQVLNTVRGSDLAVVEGLRFREDVEFFASRFSSRFLHVHLTAEADHRMRAFIKRGVASADEWHKREGAIFKQDEEWIARQAHLVLRTDALTGVWLPALTAFVETSARALLANPVQQ